jgi:hypothetical protein
MIVLSINLLSVVRTFVSHSAVSVSQYIMTMCCLQCTTTVYKCLRWQNKWIPLREALSYNKRIVDIENCFPTSTTNWIGVPETNYKLQGNYWWISENYTGWGCYIYFLNGWLRKVVVTFFKCVKIIFLTTNERTFQPSLRGVEKE